MFTTRKRHLRKKRFFLPKEEIFALFNSSNIKTLKVTQTKIALQNAKLYSVPLFLQPPKICLGYPLIMVVYERLEDLQTNFPKVVDKIDCLGVSIHKKWYPIEIFKKESITSLDKDLITLFLIKEKEIREKAL